MIGGTANWGEGHRRTGADDGLSPDGPFRDSRLRVPSAELGRSFNSAPSYARAGQGDCQGDFEGTARRIHFNGKIRLNDLE